MLSNIRARVREIGGVQQIYGQTVVNAAVAIFAIRGQADGGLLIAGNRRRIANCRHIMPNCLTIQMAAGNIIAIACRFI